MLLARRLSPSPTFVKHFARRTSALMSYSAAASQGGSNNEPASYSITSNSKNQPRSQLFDGNGDSDTTRQKRSPSPAHLPVTQREGESTYVLTLLTDQAHHKRMTALRDKYFPEHINKLGAHLTLFHALPGSRLDDRILPTIHDVVSNTYSFKVHAVRPFRLKRGMAISVAKNHGSAQAQEVHNALQRPWLDAAFLSEQDQGGCRVHYTVMNKVDDDAEVEKALEELQGEFRGDWGVAEGLGLWRYDKGYWTWQRRFDFQQNE